MLFYGTRQRSVQLVYNASSMTREKFLAVMEDSPRHAVSTRYIFPTWEVLADLPLATSVLCSRAAVIEFRLRYEAEITTFLNRVGTHKKHSRGGHCSAVYGLSLALTSNAFIGPTSLSGRRPRHPTRDKGKLN